VGPQAIALAVLLNEQFGVSLGKIAALFRSRVALHVTPSALVRALHRAAAQNEPTYRALCETVRTRPVVIPDETGWKVGPYETRAPIGQGGMGEVYRAGDAGLGRDVAIKILPAGSATDPDRLARFEREARTLASLNHPDIAHIHGVEDAGSTHAIVMEPRRRRRLVRSACRPEWSADDTSTVPERGLGIPIIEGVFPMVRTIGRPGDFGVEMALTF
jgi:hypothetical protein